MAQSNPTERIAIIGMGMRLPGRVHNASQYWDMLVNGKSGRCRVPSDRYNIETWYGSDGVHRVGTEYGYFLDDLNLAHIDSSFWSMSKQEAEFMDPQQRLLLEVVHETLESSGTVNWRGRDIGVYIGVMGDDWASMRQEDNLDPSPIRADVFGDYIIANRVSYEFDLKGPSMMVRTACSSSLTALHVAIQDIRSGICESAVVGGVNLILSHQDTVSMTEQGVLSPTGSCKTFDASADGYARGEAITAVYIKKMADAVRDEDPIRAVIRSTCISNDGKTPGLTVPDPISHEKVIRKAYKLAGIDDVSKTAMVECHGTGTPVGDPLETSAVSSIWGGSGIYIGSVKPNIGHGEGASGLSSLIKAVLSLENKTIPPNINFHVPNPSIPWGEGKLQVPTKPTAWPVGRHERVSINSFGIGGANAHVILESAASNHVDKAPTSRDSSVASQHHLLMLSAKHEKSAEKYLKDITDYLDAYPANLADAAYSLASRRHTYPLRAFCVTDGRGILKPSRIVKTSSSQGPPVVWAFTGQGAQWAEMGKELIENHPLVRRSIDKLDAFLALQPNPPPWTIKDEILTPKSCSRLYEAEFSQPCLAAIQIALVDLLRSWGVTPDAVVGHSSGETPAAYASGAITAEDAILLAYHRGQITPGLKAAHKGGMCAVGMGRLQSERYLRDGVIVGCENSPSSVTLSGDADVLEEVMNDIRHRHPDVLVRALRVECGYHSAHMKTVAPDYASRLAALNPSLRPRVPFYSSVTGTLSTDLSRNYWVQNIISPVLFSTAVESLLADIQSPIFVEIGPHSTFAGPIRQISQGQGMSADYIPTLVRNTNAMSSVLATAGQLWQADVSINIGAVNPPGTFLTDLPTYSWHHDETFWKENRISRERRMQKFGQHELLGVRIVETSSPAPTWRCILRVEDVHWLRDHNIQGDIVVPAMAFVGMIGEAVRQLTGYTDFTMKHITLGAALFLTHESVEIITALNPVIMDGASPAWFDFSVSSRDGDAWTRHAGGRCRGGCDFEQPVLSTDQLPRRVPIHSFYDMWKKHGLDYGNDFRRLGEVTSSVLESKAAGTVQPASLHGSCYAIHPTMMDASLHVCMVAESRGLQRNFKVAQVPVYIEQLSIRGHNAPIHVTAVNHLIKNFPTNSEVIGQHEGNVVFHVQGLRVLALERGYRVADPSVGTLVAWKPDISFINTTSLVREAAGVRDHYQVLKIVAIACMFQRDALLAASYENASDPDASIISTIAAMDSKSKTQLIMSSVDTLKGTNFCQLALMLCQSPHFVVSTSAAIEPDLQERNSQRNVEAAISCIDEMAISDFLDLFSHQRPDSHILEIGAGGGGTTAAILHSLKSEYDERVYTSYTYTEPSKELLDVAQETLKGFAAVRFATLDITKTLLEQGFQEAYFDLVIVSNVLGVRASTTEALKNIRRLLKPRGRLVLREMNSPVSAVDAFIRALCGLSLPVEKDGQVTLETLRQADFDVDGATTVRGAMTQVLITMALSENHSISSVSVLCGDPRNYLVLEASEYLATRGIATTMFPLGKKLPPGQVVLCLLDLENPFLYDMTEEDFENLKTSLLPIDDAAVLWVTGASQIECHNPNYSLTQGFTRTVRKEISIDVVSLELDSFTEPGWDAMTKVLKTLGGRTLYEDVNEDAEYVFSRGQIYSSRFHWVDMAKHFQEKACANSAMTLALRKSGEGEGLCLKQVEPTLMANDIVVEVRAVGLQQSDSDSARAHSTTSSSKSARFGSLGSGIVSAVGKEVAAVEIGDRVAFFLEGSFANRITIAPALCVKLPAALTFEQAASMPFTYAGAMYSVLELGKLRHGQSVLVHSACEGLGLAAVKIAKTIEADIFCTVTNVEERKQLTSSLGIPAQRIFYRQRESFLPGLLRETSGRGVDLVINNLTESSLLCASWDCVAPLGVMVNIGSVDRYGASRLELDLFRETRTFTCLDLDLLNIHRPLVLPSLLGKVFDMFDWDTAETTIPIEVFPLSKLDSAFLRIRERLFLSTVVVTIPEDLTNIDDLPVESELGVRSDATYVLIGGLGGLGQACARWLVEKGARYLVFFSRSASKLSKTNQWFVHELEAFGCHVQTISGNIEDMADASKILSSAIRPIAGVLHAAMVLQDENLSNMAFEQWQAVVLPKVKGTWNVHHVLQDQREPVDFFFLFSSLSGLGGQIGQANYAAANSFLDAFVQYRHSIGLACSVLDIGMVEDIGILAREKHRFEALRSATIHPLHEKDILDALELMIRPSQSLPPTTKQGECRWPSYVSAGQMAIGLRIDTSRPLSASLAGWHKDSRTAIHRNHAHLQSEASTRQAQATLKEYLQDCRSNPAILESEEAANFFAREIRATLQSFMMRINEEIDLTAPLDDIGVDSLISVELRNWLKHKTGVVFTVAEILRAGCIQQLGEITTSKLKDKTSR